MCTCSILKEWLQQAGGWQLNSAMDGAYAIGAHPGAACAAAGFRGLTSYYPAQRTARPPDNVVKLMLGTVLQDHDPATGTTARFDIDEAITKSEQYFQTDGKGRQSATPMFKALRVLAEALARVRMVEDAAMATCGYCCRSPSQSWVLAGSTNDPAAVARTLDLPSTPALQSGQTSS